MAYHGFPGNHWFKGNPVNLRKKRHLAEIILKNQSSVVMVPFKFDIIFFLAHLKVISLKNVTRDWIADEALVELPLRLSLFRLISLLR